MQMTLFLKRVLLLDAASCLGMGARPGRRRGDAGRPARPAGGLLSGAGMSLLPLGLFMAFVATRAAPPASSSG